MRSTLRAFIAIELSPEIRNKIKEISTSLQEKLKDEPIRWVSPDNIHLTIKFLGEVSLAHLEELKKMLAEEGNRHSTFEIEVGKLGAYPNNQRPRVIWIGVSPPSELINIQRRIEDQVKHLGAAGEDRPFSPHLTLGRAARQANLSQILKTGQIVEAYQIGVLGVMQVKSIHLFKSDLRPGGAVYTRIFSAALSALSANENN